MAKFASIIDDSIPTTEDRDSSITETAHAAQPRRLFPFVLVAAVIMRAAFAPLDWGWLAWIGLAPLFYILPFARRARHAFALGYLFGIVQWGWTITWIGTTVTNWSGSSIGWIAWILLTLIKSLWFGLFGVLAWWVGKRTEGHLRVVCTAAAWTLVEWLRGQTLIAMPWALIGYTQWKYLPIIQAADLGGVYLISFELAWMNAGLAEVFRCSGVQVFRRSGVQVFGRSGVGDRTNTRTRTRVLGLSGVPAFRHSGVGVLGAPFLLLLALVSYGFLAQRARYDGPSVRIALMQPNVRSERSGAADERDLRTFAKITEQVKPLVPEIVLWPESIAPHDAVNDPNDRQAFSAMARTVGAWTLVGTGYMDAQERPYNSAALFAPDGRLAERYDKHWLVPMGEWIVGRSWLPFGKVFQFPKYDVVPGTSDEPVVAGPAKMAVLICYETVFPIVPRTRVLHGADLLVSITNDSWAGKSSELDQHFAMAVFRAIETRRYLVCAATTGITGMIEPNGRMNTIAPYRQNTQIVEPRLLQEKAIYVRWGDWVVGLCGLALIWGLWRGSR